MREFKSAGAPQFVMTDKVEGQHPALVKFDQATDGLSIPDQVLDFTRTKIEEGIEIFEGKRSVDKVDFVFPVNERTLSFGQDELGSEHVRKIRHGIDTTFDPDDCGQFWPALSRKYGVNTHARMEVYERVPPWLLSMYFDGSGDLRGYGVGVPVTARMLANGQRDIASGRIAETVEFMNELTNPYATLALSGMMPSATDLGLKVEHLVESGKSFTTGHDGTGYLMIETIKRIAEANGLQLDKELIGILGVGSINGSVANILLREGIVGGLVVKDRKMLQPAVLARRLDMTVEELGDYEIYQVETMDEFVQMSTMAQVATSTAAPVLDYPDIPTVDDSQPPHVPRHGGHRSAWPVGFIPGYMRLKDTPDGWAEANYGPYGLVSGGEEGIYVWGCEMNTIALADVPVELRNGDSMLRVAGPTTAKRVAEMSKVLHNLGYGLHPNGQVQSYGQLFDPRDFSGIINTRNERV